MDFSRFSDENFEAKDWINTALKAHKDAGISLDAHASNIVMKLQLFIQEVNKSLEETSHAAVNNLPRVLREVEGIREDATNLKQQMQMIKDDIRKIDENTSKSMQNLVEIDTVKERMQAASNALQEADNWTTLSSDVDKIFQNGDIHEIAEKLIGMQKSLTVLEDVPDYAERRRLLESLKNKLEALLSTKIVTAFNNHALDEAKQYVNIFTEIGRLEQLQTYYNNCHKGKLLKIWNELREDPTVDITIWLPKFYDNLLSLWHSEIAWCGQVFKDPVAVLSSLLVLILKHVEPSIPQCIIQNLHGDEPSLSLLIRLKQISFRLITALETSFKGQTAPLSSSQPVIDLISTIQEPYSIYMLRYSEIQQAELMNGIDHIQVDFSGLSDTVVNMSESVCDAFRYAEEAQKSCWEFTDGYGILELLESLEIFFSAYFGKLDNAIIALRKVCEMDGNSVNGSKGLEDEDQWTKFQNAFKIIEMCGQLMMKMSDFRDVLTNEIKAKLQGIFDAENSDTVSHMNDLRSNRSKLLEELREFHERINSYYTKVVLSSTQEQIDRLNEHAHKFAFDIVFVQLRRQIEEIPHLQIWSTHSQETEAITDDLPTFSLSPQGCITQVGDYLLTLPQQLETFFTYENTSLLVALKAGQIPFADKQDSDVENDHYWVIGFAKGTMDLFVENILKIPELTTEHSVQQLIADIDYLCNILEAVEVHPSNELKTIRELLQIDKTRFREHADDVSADQFITNSIARMRKV